MKTDRNRNDSSVRKGKIAAVILGAGGSRRLRRPKQLLQFHGKTLIVRVVEQAVGSGCDPVIVVTGAYAAHVMKELEHTAAQVVVNPDWQEGKGSSIRIGMGAACESSDLTGVVILACDQPLLPDDYVEKLIDCFRETGSPIVASRYDGTIGIPAFFSRELFPELLALSGDEGAKGIIAVHHTNVQSIEFPEGALDIDTEEDFVKLQSRG